MLKNALSIAIAALVFAAQSAKADETCDMYSVASGDTLRLIAERYYGARSLSYILYDANIETVGEDPNTIEIGMVLAIPCRDGISIPLSTSFIGAEQAVQHNTAAYFVARANTAPFIDEQNLGVIPDILAAALRHGGFVDDLKILRPAGTAEILEKASGDEALLSFPWIKPNCAEDILLPEQAIDICVNYTFSNALYEITLGLFTIKGSAYSSSSIIGDFQKNTRFCVPAFYEGRMVQDLELMQNEDFSTVIAANNTICVDGLLQGEFDVILSDYQTMKTMHRPQIADIPGFANSATVHAMANSRNASAMAALKMANLGLVTMLESGEWFEIVNRNMIRLNEQAPTQDP